MLIHCQHDKGLNYGVVNKNTAPLVPVQLQQLSKQGALVVTFRALESGRPDKQLTKLTAVERFLWLKNEQVIFYGLETDSPLAPLILWDVAHVAEIGSSLTLMGDRLPQSFLERPYFSKAFELVEKENGRKVFIKREMLPAELDAGLDAWTFGIPVGPEDATLLNATVKRILELDVPKKEILLCGQPGKNFKYFDQVRIVGEDITAPPVRICAKKNRLAQEASHPNLCIIHDRVFLPSNFYEAVTRFGDFYPLTTMQSVFFDDKYNLIPKRYSDFAISHRAKDSIAKGLMRDNDVEALSSFAPAVLPELESFSFFSAANIARYHTGNYPTGSMYICKRSVWAMYPENENLHWIEFEDLEHAYRAVAGGVPSRVNPFTITQSLISRPILARPTGSLIDNMKGTVSLQRAWSEMLPISRKPMLKVTQDTVLDCMQKFINKYVVTSDPLVLPASVAFNSRKRLEMIIQILSLVQIPIREKELREFIHDYQKWIIFDQLGYAYIEYICSQVLVNRIHLVDLLVKDSDVLTQQIAARLQRGIFCTLLSDYLQKPSLRLNVGTFISALYLFATKRKIIYLKGGILGYFRALKKSTPFEL